MASNNTYKALRSKNLTSFCHSLAAINRLNAKKGTHGGIHL